MARTNLAAAKDKIYTHERAVAQHINPEQQLRRLVLAHMLWENQFYIDGISAADQVREAIKNVAAEKVSAIAIEARERQKLRHIPLFICREMAALPTHQKVVAETLARVIQRPDELAEYVSLYDPSYLKRGTAARQPLSAQSKRGLAEAFKKFDAYQLAKYDRDDGVKLRDVLFLCHAKPKDKEQAAIWKQLIDRTLPAPDTWEVSLSAGSNKKETFERLIGERKLGALALLRNLRNMRESKVEPSIVFSALGTMKLDRVLPFRFIAAANHVPEWESQVEQAMLRACESMPRLKGKTALVVDNSGSMVGTKVSAKSEIDRSDAACALAILGREICEDVVVIGFGSNAAVIPARRGFALRDAIKRGPGGGTNTQDAIMLAANRGYDRIVIVTDEQSHQSINNPLVGTKGYVINVAAYKNGIGYGQWTHVDGWSESVLDFIRASEE